MAETAGASLGSRFYKMTNKKLSYKLEFLIYVNNISHRSSSMSNSINLVVKILNLRENGGKKKFEMITVKKRRQALCRHEIRDEQFLVLGKVEGSERNHIVVLNLPQHLHLHLELPLGHRHVLQPLHNHRGPFL
jgi:hypothetical protein